MTAKDLRSKMKAAVSRETRDQLRLLLDYVINKLETDLQSLEELMESPSSQSYGDYVFDVEEFDEKIQGLRDLVLFLEKIDMDLV